MQTNPPLSQQSMRHRPQLIRESFLLEDRLQAVDDLVDVAARGLDGGDAHVAEAEVLVCTEALG